MLLRSVILACCFGLMTAFSAFAHDGPHQPQMVAEVVSAQTKGNSVSVRFRVFNVGGPLVLKGVQVNGAAPVSMVPVPLNFAEDAVIPVQLHFGRVPQAFIMTLDFGVAGHGLVTVVPDAVSP